VIADGLRPASVGIAAGVLGAVMVGRFAGGMLRGIAPFDLPSLAAVAAVLLGAALAACYVAARRAADVDPAHTLRES
jgi:putative ABC transport system permease protein